MSLQYLPQAVIVAGEPGEQLDSYLDARTSATDELLYIDEHPNTAKTSTGIYIDDIRNLQIDVRSAKKNTRTIVVLRDAAKMTTQSQNALLKLLEEPRKDLYFVLQTHTPMQLLDTIRSRSQFVSVQSAASIELPADTQARIRFMAGGSRAEELRLAQDSRYFEQRSRLFELAKRFVGGSSYERLVIVKQVGDKRDTALEFIGVCQVMYRTLIQSRFSVRLRDEAALLLDIDEAIRKNGNTKLQLLRSIV